MKRALVFVTIAIIALVAFELYRRASRPQLNVTPEADRVIEKAKER